MHRDAEAMTPLCGARSDAETRDYPREQLRAHDQHGV